MSEEKIVALNNDYNSLTTSTEDLDCTKRAKFIKIVESFTAKYELFEPISIKITKGFDGEIFLANNEHIKISYHTADIHFKAGVTFFLYFRFKSVAKYMYKLLQSDKS